LEFSFRKVDVMRVQIGAAIVLFAGVALAGGCDDGHGHHTAGEAQAPVAAEARSEATEPVGRAVKANFELVEALSRDDVERSKRAAEQTREALKALPAEHEAQVAKMDAALAQVIAAENLAAQRKAFEPFSHELIELVRAHGAGDAGETHVALCWMVNGGDAFWLQPQRQITNPYHGSGMYRCGRIVETVQE
jgi:membrane fusion protein, copper/silver efflux system